MNALFALLASALLTAASAQDAKLPDSLQYQGRSVELPMAQKGIYLRAAETLLPRLAKQKKDWAVVLDLDETVLDNFEYGLRAAKAEDDDDEAIWKAWAAEGKAKAVPGAKEFLDRLRAVIKSSAPGAKGRIVFMSNREAAHEKATRDNLAALGLWGEGDALLLRRDKADTKEARRACVAAGKTGADPRCGWAPAEIAAVFGDSFRDFFEVYGKDVYETGRRRLEECVDRGVCFVLPNAMYGQWQAEPGAQPYE
jgi:5'-nucleotidase (lipoprotein e(P4) family)